MRTSPQQSGDSSENRAKYEVILGTVPESLPLPPASGLWVAVLVLAAAGAGCRAQREPCPPGQVEVGGGCAIVDHWEPGCCRSAGDCGNRWDWICGGNCDPANPGASGYGCVPLCESDARCKVGEVCEDFFCRTPACAFDEDCGSGRQCVGDRCVPAIQPEAVSSCLVLPQRAVLRTGMPRDFHLVAKDSAGRTIPYKGAVTWVPTNATRLGDQTTTRVTAESAGDVTVRALVDAVECDEARALAFGDAEDVTRVVVVDRASGAPVPNALVVVDSEELASDERGAAAFPLRSGPKTVSVFSAHHSFVTFSGVEGNDLAVYLEPNRATVGFTGSKDHESFVGVQALNETVHVMYGAGSYAASVGDFDLDTILGPLQPTELDLGSSRETVPLPAGTVFGLGKQMFKPSYEVLATPGVRTLWTIGGNVSFADLSGALAPALSGTPYVNYPELISVLSPLVGRLQSGAVTAVATAEPPADGEPALLPIDIPLDVRLRLHVQAKLPELPAYSFADGSRFDSALVVGGVLYPEQGFVPLGLGAGTDEDWDTRALDGKINNPFDRTLDGHVPLRIAPRHSGLETGRFGVVAISTSLSSLFGREKPKRRVFSGLISHPDRFAYEMDPRSRPVFDLGARWLAVPHAVAVDGRTVKLDGLERVSFHRLEIGSRATGKWSVYFNAASSAVTVAVPSVPRDFAADDRYEKGDAPLRVVSVSLRSPADYEAVAALGSSTLDELSQVRAFSMREIAR